MVAINIYKYRSEIIDEITKFADTAGLLSHEISEGIRKAAEANPEISEYAKIGTWRDFIYNCDEITAIDKNKECLFKVINSLAKEKREKELDKNKKDTEWWKKDSQYWQESADWWRKYNNREHDWQKSIAKRDAENEKQLVQSKENRLEKNKKGFITDIEMRLIGENIADERLSKRLGISDWRSKIRESDDFDQALSMRTHLWDIIRKLEDEFTCAGCGEKKEKYYKYPTEEGKKYCSSECWNKGENDDSSSNTPTTRGKNYGFSNIREFFAWMKKLGVTELKFDFNTNQVIIKCQGDKQLSLAETGLSDTQQSALTQELKANSQPVTLSQIEKEVKGNPNNKKDNTGAMVLGGLVIVGIVAIIITVIVKKNKRQDY